MKVLLTNNHLSSFGGTETWVLTVYEALIALGIEVDVYTTTTAKSGVGALIPSINTITGDYDLALVNHNTCAKDVLTSKAIIKRKVMLCHGIYPELEQPIEGFDAYVAISKEVQDHLLLKGFSSTVVHNPINISRYTPTHPLNAQPMQVLNLVQSKKARSRISKLGYKSYSTAVSLRSRRELKIEMFNWADLGFSLGRGCFELLACGRCAVVYDERKYNLEGCYDGLVTKDNMATLLEKNCSGRAYNYKFDLAHVKADIEQNYVADTGYYRAIAERYFDSRKIVQQLLEV